MHQYVLADPNMISARTFDDEIVAANFSTGIYYSFQGAAAEIWYGLMAGAPVDRLAHMVGQHSQHTPQEFSRATLELVAALEREQLIKPTSTPIDDSWQPKPPQKPFGLPVYERFSDMEELLLLDPIHDVGKTGWPDALRAKAD